MSAMLALMAPLISRRALVPEPAASMPMKPVSVITPPIVIVAEMLAAT